jgi:hypothetical protein
MTITAPPPKPRAKKFTEACAEYLEHKRQALLASIAGTPTEAKLIEDLRDRCLLPNESLDDLRTEDLFGIDPLVWQGKIALGMDEAKAKRLVANHVEAVIQCYNGCQP